MTEGSVSVAEHTHANRKETPIALCWAEIDGIFRVDAKSSENPALPP